MFYLSLCDHHLSLKFFISLFLGVQALQAASEETRQPKIIIVGAGVSGIAAAACLIENGFTNIKILEAGNRIGGRLHSVNTGNWTIDLGGHWVPGDPGNIVYKIATLLGLLEITRDYSNPVLVYSDKYELISNHNLLMDKIYKDQQVKTSNDSLYDFMSKRLTPILKQELNDSERADAYLKWLLQYQCTLEGCDSLKDVSAKGSMEFQASAGSTIVGWKGKGYKSIIDLLLVRCYGSMDS